MPLSNAWVANWKRAISDFSLAERAVGNDRRGTGKRLHGTMGCLFDGSFWFGGSGDGGAKGIGV